MICLNVDFNIYPALHSINFLDLLVPGPGGGLAGT